jgi:hypothetical protein
MKRKFAKLSKREQEKVEAEYHRMKPEDFDEIMSSATRHSPKRHPVVKSLGGKTEKH